MTTQGRNDQYLDQAVDTFLDHSQLLKKLTARYETALV
jgi:hypothetical protein